MGFKASFEDTRYPGVLEDIIVGTNGVIENDELIKDLRNLGFGPREILYKFPVFNQKRNFNTGELKDSIQKHFRDDKQYDLEKELKVEDSMLEKIVQNSNLQLISLWQSTANMNYV